VTVSRCGPPASLAGKPAGFKGVNQAP
jgi:hypothetical protein